MFVFPLEDRQLPVCKVPDTETRGFRITEQSTVPATDSEEPIHMEQVTEAALPRITDPLTDGTDNLEAVTSSLIETLDPNDAICATDNRDPNTAARVTDICGEHRV
jgi:hypothetical protein